VLSRYSGEQVILLVDETKIKDQLGVMVVAPAFPARSAHDLIRMARQEPGRITFASGGHK